MSVTSIDDLSMNNVSESSSQNNTSIQTSLDGSLQRKIEALSAEDIDMLLSAAQSVKIKISPTPTAVNSVDEKIESTAELREETSNESLSTGGFDSFTSHTLPIHSKKSSFASTNNSERQLCEDLYLPLAEEQDTVTSKGEKRNVTIGKGFANNGDLTENLISAILAFKEATQNQCNLLNAQTSAIDRLATAIEDQNLMISRFHNVVHKSNTKNLTDNYNTSKG